MFINCWLNKKRLSVTCIDWFWTTTKRWCHVVTTSHIWWQSLTSSLPNLKAFLLIMMKAATNFVVIRTPITKHQIEKETVHQTTMPKHRDRTKSAHGCLLLWGHDKIYFVFLPPSHHDGMSAYLQSQRYIFSQGIMYRIHCFDTYWCIYLYVTKWSVIFLCVKLINNERQTPSSELKKIKNNWLCVEWSALFVFLMTKIIYHDCYCYKIS